MRTVPQFRFGIWALTVVVVAVALYVWWPRATNLTLYTFFPLLGLVAFSLMWVHYIAGALRRYLRLPEGILKRHFRITSFVVLLSIIAHPFLLYLQLYLDGLGLPLQSIPMVYPTLLERIAIYIGVTSLMFFLLFELHRFYGQKTWWKYIEWLNVAAMVMILWHGFTLGGELRQPWFQIIWGFYGVTFVAAVAYSEYSKRRKHHESTTVTSI